MSKYTEAISHIHKHGKTMSESDALVIVEALEQMQALENPTPLTLEQLRERAGKTIYIRAHKPANMPYVDMKSRVYVFLVRSFTETQMSGATVDAQEWRQLSEHGIWWDAYDYPPKEAK
jgi:hypothetical protein